VSYLIKSNVISLLVKSQNASPPFTKISYLFIPRYTPVPIWSHFCPPRIITHYYISCLLTFHYESLLLAEIQCLSCSFSVFLMVSNKGITTGQFSRFIKTKLPHLRWWGGGVIKIFRTDALKIIKLTIRLIGRHHPRSSSLPHVETGPTNSSNSGTLRGRSFLSKCQALSAIRSGSPQWHKTGVFSASIPFLETGRSHRMPNQGSTLGGGWQPFYIVPETAGWGRKCEAGFCHGKAARSVLTMFGATSSHVFTQSPQNFAVECGIYNLACWDRCFALPQLPYRWRHQSEIFWIPPRNILS
jgi:hypothetical protein